MQLFGIPDSLSEVEVRYELEGTLGVLGFVQFANISIENYMIDTTEVRSRASVRMSTSEPALFYTSYKQIIAAAGVVAYVTGHPLSVIPGGYEGIPRGYFEVELAKWKSRNESTDRNLSKVFETVDTENVYHVQSLLYYTKIFKFRSEVYESLMNLVRFLECIVLGVMATKRSTKDPHVNLTTQTNLKHLLSIGLGMDDLEKLIELNELRNQLVAHGLLSPEIEELFGIYEQSRNMPKYYEVTPGPTYGLEHFIAKRMDAVNKAFKQNYGCVVTCNHTPYFGL